MIKRILLCSTVVILVTQLPFLVELYRSYRLQSYLQEWHQYREATFSPFRDFRGGIHIHTAQGGHSLATYSQLYEAAKEVDYDFLFLTEHPKPKPVLAQIEDSELVVIFGYEREELGRRIIVDSEETLLLLTEFEGVQIPTDFDGLELFSLHESAALSDTWYNRVNLLYHLYFLREMFGFHLWVFPWDRLRVWDRALDFRALTGFAGPDAHQNIGLIVMTADGRRLLRFQLDPYQESLRFVSTHVFVQQAQELSAKGVLEALRQGSAYIAFEKVADSTGFSFHARAKGDFFPMGSHVQVGSELIMQSPLPCQFRLYRNGERYKLLEGHRFTLLTTEPGVYRVELFPPNPPGLLEGKPWIISNPLFVE